jgi:hypothetical protein
MLKILVSQNVTITVFWRKKKRSSSLNKALEKRAKTSIGTVTNNNEV